MLKKPYFKGFYKGWIVLIFGWIIKKFMVNSYFFNFSRFNVEMKIRWLFWSWVCNRSKFSVTLSLSERFCFPQTFRRVFRFLLAKNGKLGENSCFPPNPFSAFEASVSPLRGDQPLFWKKGAGPPKNFCKHTLLSKCCWREFSPKFYL